MSKQERIFEKLCEFMNKYDVNCEEDIYQVEPINEASVDLVAVLIGIMLEE